MLMMMDQIHDKRQDPSSSSHQGVHIDKGHIVDQSQSAEVGKHAQEVKVVSVRVQGADYDDHDQQDGVEHDAVVGGYKPKSVI